MKDERAQLEYASPGAGREQRRRRMRPWASGASLATEIIAFGIWAVLLAVGMLLVVLWLAWMAAGLPW